MNAVSAIALDASAIVGAEVLNIQRGDLSIGGTTVTGNKAASVTNVDASQLPKVVAGDAVTSLNIDAAAADKAGLVVDATGVTGNVTVDGASTITANESTGTVAVDAATNTTATETVKATTIDAAAAATVTTHADLTGAVTINAAKASTITVNDGQGGVTVNGGTTSTADTTITVVDIDASGATITTGTGSSLSAEKEIDIVIDGTAKTTDAASIVAGGTIDLDIDGANDGNVDILTLSGNGSDVTYRLAAPTTGTFTSMTKAGDDAVTVSGDLSEFDATTIDGIDTITINAIAGGAADLDASKWSNVGNVNIGVNNANKAITVNSGSQFTVTTSTIGTKLDFDFAATTTGGDLTLVSGDVNGSTNSAVGTASVTVLNAAAAATVEGTVTLIANDSNFSASTSTTLGAKQTLVVQGDEDVTLGTVTAKAVDATASSGIINATMGANLGTLTSGTGADDITLNGAKKHTVATGSGNDTVTVTDTLDNSSVDTGEGDDSINADDVGKVYVVNAGAGDDTVTATLGAATNDFDAVLLGGDGTDTLVFDTAAAHDFTADDDASNGADKFAFSGFEKLNINALNAALTLTAAQFANNNTMKLIGNSATDVLHVTGASTAVTIDGSGLVKDTGATATIQYTGSSKADTITGGKEAETFNQTKGADSIVGGNGSDTYALSSTGLQETGSTEAATGMVVNLGGSVITSAAVFAGISKYLGEGASQVDAGTVAYAYASADSSTINNSAVVDSLSGIENVTGSGLADYIVMSDNAGSVTGGAGDDYIKLGGGADTVVNSDIDNNGTDTLSGFTTGTDKVQLSAADLNALTGAATFAADDVVGTDAGTFASVADGGTLTGADGAGTFIFIAGSGQLIWDAAGDTDVAADDSTTDLAGDDIVIATGITSIVASDLDIVA
jgi:hypothetical protein